MVCPGPVRTEMWVKALQEKMRVCLRDGEKPLPEQLLLISWLSDRGEGPEGARLISSEIVVLVQGANVVDLARVVEVMLDHHRDDPARLLEFTPGRHARTKQLGVREDRDALPEPLLAFLQPRSCLFNACQRVRTIAQGTFPAELRIAKGVVLVHKLTAANMPDEVADRAL